MNLISKSAAVSFTLALSSAALANHGYKVELRSDLRSNSYKDMDERYESDTSELLYVVDRAKVNLMGDVGKDVKYRFRFNFNKDSGTKTSGGQSKLLDYAYITHDIADSFSLMTGRFASDSGAFENSLSSGKTFISSAFMDAAPGDVDGLALNFSPLADNTVTVMFANNPSLEKEEGPDEKTDSLKRQQTPMYGLVYTGSFGGGMFQPFLSFHVENKRELKVKDASEASKKAATNQWTGVGFLVDASAFKVGLDYKMAAVGSQAVDKAKDTSISTTTFKADYVLGDTELFAHYIADSEESYEGMVETGDKTVKDTTQVAFGALFNSSSFKGMNYHVAYTSESSESEVTTASGTKTKSDKKPSKTSLILGVNLVIGGKFASAK